MGAVKTANHDLIAAQASVMHEEANAFAMELLMPEHLLRKDAVGVSIDCDQQVAKLAKKYQVPVGVMVARLMGLSA